MGKLKEQLLNNLTPEEMDERFELSAFEYVEYMEKYKNKWQQLSLFDDNGDEIPADVLEQMVSEREQLEKQFIESMGEFNHEDYIKDVQRRSGEPDYGFRGGIRVESEWADDQSDIDEINDSIKLKYTDSDILYVLDGFVDPQKMDIIKDKLRDVWNTKNGVE